MRAELYAPSFQTHNASALLKRCTDGHATQQTSLPLVTAVSVFSRSARAFNKMRGYDLTQLQALVSSMI